MIPVQNPSLEIKTTSFFGLPVVNEDRESVILFFRNVLKARSSVRVTTMNAQIGYYSMYTPGFFDAIKDSIIIPDGVGLLWAVKRMKGEVLSRFPGVELGVELCRLCQQEGHSVFLLGSKKGVAEQAAVFLRRTTQVEIAGCMDGFFSKTDEGHKQVVNKIRESGASLLLVGMGAPYQEFWLSRHFSDTGTAVGIGVGGSIDVYAGQMKRAPGWIIRCNMEWLYRILQNPRKKWKVIFQIGKFVQKVLFYRDPS